VTTGHVIDREKAAYVAWRNKKETASGQAGLQSLFLSGAV
jgi:hypothetical protein